jgi:hypothetical protein
VAQVNSADIRTSRSAMPDSKPVTVPKQQTGTSNNTLALAE